MARPVNSDDYGKTTPKLTPDDLEGEVVVLTLATFDEVEVEDPEQDSGKRRSPFLTFQETGDKRLWINKGQVDTLIARLGNDADRWAGQPIPVEAKDVKFGNTTYHKVVVVEPKHWDGYLADAGLARPTTRATTPVTAKRAAKGKGKGKAVARGRR